MKKILFTSLIILFCFAVWGQDIHFSQFNNTPLMTNPALTGAFRTDHRIIANYRSQWKKISDSYMTYGLSYDMGFLKKKLNYSFLALGIQFFHDKSGIINLGHTQINLSAAYHITVDAHNVLAVGMQGGWYQRNLNTTNMIFGSQFDPNSPDGYNSSFGTGENMPLININYGDVSAGFLWTYNSKKSTVSTSETKKFNVGMAIFHINRPRQSISNLQTDRLYMKFAFHVNSSIGFKNSKLSLLPSIACFFQGPTHDIVFGNLFSFRLNAISFYTNNSSETSIAFGAFYRTSDAIIVMAHAEWRNLMLTLSYDINTSKLSAASNGAGGFEISLKFMAPIASSGSKNLY